VVYNQELGTKTSNNWAD